MKWITENPTLKNIIIKRWTTSRKKNDREIKKEEPVCLAKRYNLKIIRETSSHRIALACIRSYRLIGFVNICRCIAIGNTQFWFSPYFCGRLHFARCLAVYWFVCHLPISDIDRLTWMPDINLKIPFIYTCACWYRPKLKRLCGCGCISACKRL